MSSRAASRIVIGVGLAAVFVIGISIVMEQGTQNQAAHNVPAVAAPSDQTAVKPPAADAAASSRSAATEPKAPPAVASPEPSASNPPAAVNQPVLNGTNSASSGRSANESSAPSNDTIAPKPRQASRHAQSTASVKTKSSAPPNDGNLKNAHGDRGTGATTRSSPPAEDDVVVSSETTSSRAAEARPASENSSGSSGGGADVDGQITAHVRSSISNLAPGTNIDVKAISGIVALAGSVPSQDLLEQARQAAQQVPGVKQVDTSALLVRNQ